MADDLKDANKQNAARLGSPKSAGPKQAGADGVNVQQHSLGDQTRLR